MYNVSNGYLTAFKKPVHRWKIKGTVGNVAFNDDNILTGSFHLSNACSGNDDITLGMANIGQLSATFVGLNIQKTKWKNKDVYVEIGLTKSGGQVEYVPVGTYRITSAEHSAEGVTVEAYDNMRLFDKPFAMQLYASNCYDMLLYACQQCGVELGMNNLNGFCNASAIVNVDSDAEVETYRDLIYWIAQLQCAFATIDREGKLVLRRFVSNVADTIDADQRYNTSRFEDYATLYTGISVVVTSQDETRYYHTDPDDGVTINLGSNPLLQGVEPMRKVLIDNMLAEIGQIQYTPFTSTMLGGMHYDLGDVLTEADGLGDGATCIITGYDYNYNVGFEMYGVGANPNLSNAKSKTDKNLQGLLNQQKTNEVGVYEAKNTAPIVIDDEENKRIILVRIASNKSTKAVIHVEVNLESIANTPTSTIEVDEDHNIIDMSAVWEQIRDTALKGKVTYLVNSVEDELHPIESWIDGKHVLHLMYVMPLESGIASQFEVYLQSLGGTIEIDRGGVWLHASGVGLVGEDKWDGYIEIVDEVFDFNLIEIGFEGADETVSVDTQVPISTGSTDTAPEWTIGEIAIGNVNDRVTIILHSHRYPRVTESRIRRVTEDRITRVTEGE